MAMQVLKELHVVIADVSVVPIFPFRMLEMVQVSKRTKASLELFSAMVQCYHPSPIEKKFSCEPFRVIA